MNRRDLSTLGKIFLGIWFTLLILLMIILKIFPLQKPVSVNLRNATPCREIGGKWVRAENFNISQTIYICGYINSNDQNLHKQIQIRAYKDEITTQGNAVYYDNIWISNGELVISLNNAFSPGKYVIQISTGKKTLDIVEVSIVK